MESQVHNTIIRTLQWRIASLLLYRNVFRHPATKAYGELIGALLEYEVLGGFTARLSCVAAYGQWFQAMVATGESWSSLLAQRICSSDNSFSSVAQNQPYENLPIALITAARHDLNSLQTLAQWDAHRLISTLDQSLPPWVLDANLPFPFPEPTQSGRTWDELIPDLAQYYRTNGVGIFSRFMAFTWHNSALKGVKYPDSIAIDDLQELEWQKSVLLKNTESLLAGHPALHVLLYGSRGTGKSSLVKSLVGRYGAQGLRLIEVAKQDLKDLAAVAEQIRDSPLKFIIFVDDLSFEAETEDYKALKVVLEGNITAKPQNLVVYATSNRRHLLREYHSDRPRPSDSEDVHPWDTMQEKLSLADRFGIALTFTDLNQTSYLSIVHHLAKQAQIQLDEAELNFRALQWATRHNGRSGRTARQFMDYLIAEMG
ncbi:MAG: ATP-binding protein [Pseudanabaena sp. ELA607]